MLFVRPTSYLTPQPYRYYSNQDYHHYSEAPQYAVSPYPALRQHYFYQPSAEELEENEYRRALEVVANHRRRQAAGEAAIRRQQHAEAARQQYFAVLAAELEQQRQEELLAARRAEFIRSQQARARLVAAERRHAAGALLQQLGGGQPVCRLYVHCKSGSNQLLLQVTRHPHVAKRRSLEDALKQRLAAESDSGITEPIRNILSHLEPRPAQSEQSEDSKEDVARLIEDIISSIFPGLVFRAQPQPTRPTETARAGDSDKGKGKARTVNFEEPRKPAPKPESAGDPFADILRHAMELSRSTPTPRSPNEAGPSGSSRLPPTAKPAISEREQAQIDRAIALSSVERVQDSLARLRKDFVLPAELDHYTSSTDNHDDTVSISSVSSSDLTKLIPYTSANKLVYKYENELNGLLEELDRIDSRGDVEVREKRKEVVKAIEKTLEGVGQVVGEAVEKRLSLASVTTPVTVGPLQGFDVDEGEEDLTDETIPTPEQADTRPAVVDAVAAPELLTPLQVEETTVAPAEVSTPAPDAFPESDPFVSSDATADALAEPTSAESDIQAPTATITPVHAEFTPATESEPIKPQVPVDAPEVVDTFLSTEQVLPASPVKKSQEIVSDADEEVLVFDSDVEKSDWSDLDH